MTNFSFEDNRKCSHLWCCNGDCSECDHKYETTEEDYREEEE